MCARRASNRCCRDPEKTRRYERERTRRQTEARRAEGLCTGCGKTPAAPGRASCEPCLEQRRADDRARYAAGKAAGKPYGGANPVTKRRAARARSMRRKKAWREAGLCVRCGSPPAVEGTTSAIITDRFLDSSIGLGILPAVSTGLFRGEAMDRLRLSENAVLFGAQP